MVRPIVSNLFPGWRDFAADPGLRCLTPLGYLFCRNRTHLAKFGTSEFGHVVNNPGERGIIIIGRALDARLNSPAASFFVAF